MRHARPEDLDRLDDLLGELRALPGLKETSRGTFYAKSRAFLHFHEHGGALIADLRDAAGRDFERLDVTAPAGRTKLLTLARARLA